MSERLCEYCQLPLKAGLSIEIGVGKFAHKECRGEQVEAVAAESAEEKSVFGEAVRLARETTYISCSLMQRRMHISYTRAAIILDRLRHEGVVSMKAEPYSCIYKILDAAKAGEMR